jgi:hypothetical protein
MTNAFESSFVFRPDVRVILHSPDSKERVKLGNIL